MTKFSQLFHPGLPIGSHQHHLCPPSAPPASQLVFLPAPASAVFPISSAVSFPSIFSSLLSLERKAAPRFKQRALSAQRCTRAAGWDTAGRAAGLDTEGCCCLWGSPGKRVSVAPLLGGEGV
uniref:Uncharacterized protein n=1 Tax=Strix occidentalis caurina TaxID=311401 RepID=A0A8D0F3N0_STROC